MIQPLGMVVKQPNNIPSERMKNESGYFHRFTYEESRYNAL